MIGDMLLPVLAASAAGGAGWWWHANLRRSAQSHADRSTRARARGWDYASVAGGFAVVGRTLSCEWELRSNASGESPSSCFEMGAPDRDRAVALVRAFNAPPVDCGLAAWDVGSEAVHELFAIDAQTGDDARRIIDGEMEDLLIGWAEPRRVRFRSCHQTDNPFEAWVCPHGIAMRCGEALDDWLDIERLIGLGIALGRRAGLP